MMHDTKYYYSQQYESQPSFIPGLTIQKSLHYTTVFVKSVSLHHLNGTIVKMTLKVVSLSKYVTTYTYVFVHIKIKYCEITLHLIISLIKNTP